jgi:hypothetical protein
LCTPYITNITNGRFLCLKFFMEQQNDNLEKGNQQQEKLSNLEQNEQVQQAEGENENNDLPTEQTPEESETVQETVENELVQETEDNAPVQETVENEPILDAEEQPTEVTEVVDEPAPIVEEVKTIELSAESNELLEHSQQLKTMEEEIVDSEIEQIDYSTLTVFELLEEVQKVAASVTKVDVSATDYKLADEKLKSMKPFFDTFRSNEKKDSLDKYIEANGSEEGFEYHAPESIVQFEKLFKNVKESRTQHFNNLEKAKEKNVEVKLAILDKMRILADAEEAEPNQVKENLNQLKALQQAWKDAGNFSSTHNATLWQTYHALADRFYSNRSIYFNLLDLDRKKNLNQKVELCDKMEKLAEKAQADGLSMGMLKEANILFDDYKHVGPAQKEANELIWTRFKVAIDSLYDLRRQQFEQQKVLFEDTLKAKKEVVESVKIFTSFTSDKITDWIAQSKALEIIQQQWEAIKGPTTKEEGRTVAKEYWASVKLFYKNKSDFFKDLEERRGQNLVAKVALCEQVEEILATGVDSPENAKAVIQLQVQFKEIGQVPEKQKDKIYKRFKDACDGYFNIRRSKNKEVDAEFEQNLSDKLALITQIEQAAQAEGAEFSKVAEFKAKWATIGFVPKDKKAETQQKFVDAINAYVKALGTLSDEQKQSLKTEAEARGARNNGPRGGNNTRGGSNNRPSSFEVSGGSLSQKIKNLENDIATTRNNMAFFSKSKNAEKILKDFEVKIQKAEQELKSLKDKLKGE